MNAPYDNESGHRGEDPRQSDDAYTRDAYRGYRQGDDDPYSGVDELLTHAEEREEQRLSAPPPPAAPPGGAGDQQYVPQFPSPPPYDPRAGGYSTAQFVAGQFE